MATLAIPEELLSGLRNYWYPILRSQDLGADAPVGITRIGEKLALWRDNKGAPHVFADRCAHRGAPVSLGRLNGDDRLECRYHGLRYDSTGQCRLVPTEHEGEDGPVARELRLRTYPTEEKGGIIWCYIGEVDLFPPPPLQIEPELIDPEYDGRIEAEVWDANWLLVHDNTCDPAHLPFLHKGVPILPPQVAVVDQIRAERTEAGILTTRVGVDTDSRWSGQTFDAVEFVLPCLVRLYVPVPDGGAPLRVLQWELPVDKEKTQVIAYFGRKVENEAQRQQWRLMYDMVIWPSAQIVFSQDNEICRAQGDIREALDKEYLIASDAGVPMVRNHILQAYRAQEEALVKAAASR